ncbi:MAG: hypothetical protein AAF208_11740 [Cyanobacteria bacterium P01_A01_bin.45]
MADINSQLITPLTGVSSAIQQSTPLIADDLLEPRSLSINGYNRSSDSQGSELQNKNQHFLNSLYNSIPENIHTFSKNIQNDTTNYTTEKDIFLDNSLITEIEESTDTGNFHSIGTTSLNLPHLSEADIDFYLFEDTELETSNETYIITHGWNSNGISEGQWTDLASSVQTYSENANIIFADWSDICTNPNYWQASQDTDVVGNAIADFLYIEGINPTQTTAIGHSLGAHVSGNIGERLNELTGESLDMIIGLDPAGPNFEGTASSNTSLRLDETDADRVVAFHSTKSLGYDSGLGDVDFYLNKWDDFNYRQPGQENFIADHGYPIEVLNYLYQGKSYTQPDDTVFDYDDVLGIAPGRYDISTVV